MIYVNSLETEEDIANYREWLSTKKYYSLHQYRRMFELYKKHNITRLPNLDVRIQLVNEEIMKLC